MQRNPLNQVDNPEEDSYLDKDGGHEDDLRNFVFWKEQRATVLWIQTIKDILSTDSSTADILENYPLLPRLGTQLIAIS